MKYESCCELFDKCEGITMVDDICSQVSQHHLFVVTVNVQLNFIRCSLDRLVLRLIAFHKSPASYPAYFAVSRMVSTPSKGEN